MNESIMTRFDNFYGELQNIGGTFCNNTLIGFLIINNAYKYETILIEKCTMTRYLKIYQNQPCKL